MDNSPDPSAPIGIQPSSRPTGSPSSLPSTPQASPWRSRFSFDHVKVLIIGRGPIRLEAIQVFERLGTQPCGMLLSEKDSVVYPRALSPELRHIGRNKRVHRIPDYTGNNAAEKAERIGQIVSLARREGYTHVFAGYGFMAEDFEMIQAVEQAGLGFVGPSTEVVRRAGAKDAAKALARSLGVSVTPGIDNIEALALLAKSGSGESGEMDLKAFLESVAAEAGLVPDFDGISANEYGIETVHALAERVLEAARAKRVELVTLPELQAETETRVRALLGENPGRRLRWKSVV